MRGPAYVNSSGTPAPNTGEGQSKASGIINDDDPGGRIKVNAYRAFGDYLALVHGEDSQLEEQVGVWAEYVRADRCLWPPRLQSRWPPPPIPRTG